MWTVVWKPSAEQHLAAIWLAAADRKAVTAAAHKIERMLATDPENVGQVRYGPDFGGSTAGAGIRACGSRSCCLGPGRFGLHEIGSALKNLDRLSPLRCLRALSGVEEEFGLPAVFAMPSGHGPIDRPGGAVNR